MERDILRGRKRCVNAIRSLYEQGIEDIVILDTSALCFGELKGFYNFNNLDKVIPDDSLDGLMRFIEILEKINNKGNLLVTHKIRKEFRENIDYFSKYLNLLETNFSKCKNSNSNSYQNNKLKLGKMKDIFKKYSYLIDNSTYPFFDYEIDNRYLNLYNFVCSVSDFASCKQDYSGKIINQTSYPCTKGSVIKKISSSENFNYNDEEIIASSLFLSIHESKSSKILTCDRDLSRILHACVLVMSHPEFPGSEYLSDHLIKNTSTIYFFNNDIFSGPSSKRILEPDYRIPIFIKEKISLSDLVTQTKNIFYRSSLSTNKR